MTDETKKLFDAPWTVTREEIRKDTLRYCVAKAHLDLVAIDLTHEDAHRLARLPELYDALREAADGKCWSCAGVNAETVLDNGCPKGNDETCYVAKWIEILRKVRDGK